MLTPVEDVPEWIKRLPKVEIHCHLEGAFPIAVLWELVQKYGTDEKFSSLNQLKQKFIYQNFDDFITLWLWKNSFLRSYEDFTLIASEVAKDLKKQNVHYAEIFFSPSSWIRRGFSPGRLLEAIRSGFNQTPELKVNFVADLIRNFEPEHELMVFEQLKELRNDGLIGIGLGGAESLYPARLFSRVFDLASQHGFKTTAHAGENAGPQSIWESLKTLSIQRIGHGVTAQQDPALIAYLKNKQIPLELCPYSNVCTGAVPTIKAHPLRTFLDAGLLISLNTDDPLMFGSSLIQEYDLVIRQFNLTAEEVKNLILSSVKATWTDKEEKNTMLATFTRILTAQLKRGWDEMGKT